jgi:hypothetical protein
VVPFVMQMEDAWFYTLKDRLLYHTGIRGIYAALTDRGTPDIEPSMTWESDGIPTTLSDQYSC